LGKKDRTSLKKTTEYSFVLKPSTIEGIGVYAMNDIAKGTYLKLFDHREKVKKISTKKLKDHYFLRYALEEGETLFVPENFARMSIGWYLNHSSKPNAAHVKYKYYATRKIRAGEEITIDYQTL
jgi:SET domain-containing protein